MLDPEKNDVFKLLEQIVDEVAFIETKDDLSKERQIRSLLALKDLVEHLGLDLGRFCPGGRVPASRFCPGGRIPAGRHCPEGPVPAQKI
jgi:hypothetical protein